jgi:hypothetical protein
MIRADSQLALSQAIMSRTSFQIIVELNFILYHVVIKDKRGNSCVQSRDKDTRGKNRDRI